MGITRSSFHKRRPTGGKKTLYRKKRKFELGRPAAFTKLEAKKDSFSKRKRSKYEI